MVPVPHSRPWIDDRDRAAVEAVLRSGRLATGEVRERFERAVAAQFDVAEPGVAVASGRSALHVALVALGIGDGAEVIVPTYVCDSVPRAIRAVGAIPVPCDVGEGWLMTPESVAPHVTPRTRAIVVVHLFGFFAPTASFRTSGVALIEDFAQAFPGRGMHRLEGDAGLCSFHPTKCLTTGEGGMVLARSPQVAERARDAKLAPMSDLAAALGLSQLARYDEALERRRAITARYRAALAAVRPDSLRRHAGSHGARPAAYDVAYRFPITLPGGLRSYSGPFGRLGVTVRRGVDSLVHRAMGLSDCRFPHAVDRLDTTVSLPVSPAMTDEDVRRCADAVTRVCMAAPDRRLAETA